MARSLVRFAFAGYVKTPTFYAKAIDKIIRDDLLGYMRSIMKADDRYYRKHSLYRLPRMNLMYRMLGLLYGIKGFRDRLHRNREMDKYVIEGHLKVIGRARPRG